MRLAFAGTSLAAFAALSLGCASTLPLTPDTGETKRPVVIQVATDPVPTPEPAPDRAPQNAAWIGAAGLSDCVLAGSSETTLGVWVDVPATARQTVPSSAVALVVDTSGSMSGSKIENARSAALSLVDRLSNGDLVGLYSFSDEVEERLPLTLLSSTSRPTIRTAVATLSPSGGTNLFEGLRAGEHGVFAAPGTHPVKRVVLISDGRANVGPSSPDLLGALASRGSEHGIQVTAVGVGLDYDESTLNALAVRSSGRLYHLTEASEMAAILQKEMGLLQATAATGAYVDIVPAPGVEILGLENFATTRVNDAIRVSLGSMYAGQHQDMLVRVRVTAAASGTHPLASVRLHFRDPSDGNVERVQETVARYEVTADPAVIASRQNARTREIVAVADANRLTREAAEKAAKGDVAKAAEDLARAEAQLLAKAKAAKDEGERQRMTASATNITRARKATEAAAAAPAAARPAAARAASLEANQAQMRNAGR